MRRRCRRRWPAMGGRHRAFPAALLPAAGGGGGAQSSHSLARALVGLVPMVAFCFLGHAAPKQRPCGCPLPPHRRSLRPKTAGAAHKWLEQIDCKLAPCRNAPPLCPPARPRRSPTQQDKLEVRQVCMHRRLRR